MRLTLVWAMAATLPSTSDSTARAASITCHRSPTAGRPSTRIRIASASAPSFGAVPTYRVTAVGAPWYTSGTHMWNGTAPNLKATPATRNARPTHSIREPASAPPIVACRSPMFRLPVTP